MQFFTKYIRFPAAASKQEKLIATAGSNKRGLVHIFTDLTKIIYIERGHEKSESLNLKINLVLNIWPKYG